MTSESNFSAVESDHPSRKHASQKQPFRISFISVRSANDTPLFVNYLQRSGYSVESLDSSAAVIERIKQFQPHAVLLNLDQQHEVYELLHQLHHQLGWLHLPFIVLSSLPFQADFQKAMDLGAHRYLVKPVNPQMLLQILQEEIR
jgi:two-component system cell cycle response regulator DivK